METTLIITGLLLAGFIGGALARQPRLRELECQKLALIDQCAEVFAAFLTMRRINQALGRQMEAAGLDVERVGECDCEECKAGEAVEWPEEMEITER